MHAFEPKSFDVGAERFGDAETVQGEQGAKPEVTRCRQAGIDQEPASSLRTRPTA